MKRLNQSLLPALALALLLPAASMQAQHHGGHGHGGHGVVIVGGGWGGWGWGWGWPGWYGYPGYYPGHYASAYGPRSQWAVIDTDISPEEAYVYLDGRYIGTADDFDGYPDYLYLGPGHYRIEFRLEGFQTVTKEVDAQPGIYLDFKDNLAKVPGAKQYGSYETPRLEGGAVKRFFAKRRGANAAVDPSAPREPSTYVGGENPPSGDEYPPPAAAAPAPQPRRDQYGEEWRGSHGDRANRTRLRLTVEPPDAAVYVDNRFIGTAEEINSLEQGVSISPGRHTVTVSRPGFREKTSEIEVRDGETGKLEMSLAR